MPVTSTRESRFPSGGVTLVAALTFAIGLCGVTHAQPVTQRAPSPAGVAEPLLVTIELNRDKQAGTFLVQRTPDGRFWLAVNDLPRLRLERPAVGHERVRRRRVRAGRCLPRGEGELQRRDAHADARARLGRVHRDRHPRSSDAPAHADACRRRAASSTIRCSRRTAPATRSRARWWRPGCSAATACWCRRGCWATSPSRPAGTTCGSRRPGRSTSPTSSRRCASATRSAIPDAGAGRCGTQACSSAPISRCSRRSSPPRSRARPARRRSRRPSTCSSTTRSSRRTACRRARSRSATSPRSPAPATSASSCATCSARSR